MSLLHGLDGGERRIDAVLGLVLVAGDVEGEQDRAAVLGDLALVALGERRLDVPHVRDGAQPCSDLTDGGGDGWIGGPAGPLGLHEHLLAGLVGEAGVGDARSATCDWPLPESSSFRAFVRPSRRGRWR